MMESTSADRYFYLQKTIYTIVRSFLVRDLIRNSRTESFPTESKTNGELWNQDLFFILILMKNFIGFIL